MTYTPNFSDKRVRSRIISAISFAKKYLRQDKPVSLGTRWIHHKNNFGCATNPLSQYCRDQLLICVDDRFNKDQKITKKYILNQTGLDLLEKKLGLLSNKKTRVISLSNIHIHTYSVLHLSEKFKCELDSGLVYKDSSHRLWHPMQSYPRADKEAILSSAGLVYTYDIVCSAPTLLHQYSQQIPEILDSDGTWLQGPMDLYLFHLRDYIKNRKTIRKRLAQECGVDEQIIKRLINALFQGGVISSYHKSGSYAELSGDISIIQFLQQHPILVGLREDIKVMWEYISPTMYRKVIKTKNGVIRKLPVSGKHKTALYRQLERRVLEVVKEYLHRTGNKCFLEHDGWSTEKPVDLVELHSSILKETGFDILFSTKKI